MGGAECIPRPARQPREAVIRARPQAAVAVDEKGTDGGVGQIGEGFLGAFFPTASDGILRSPQAFALIIGTAITALFLKISLLNFRGLPSLRFHS